MKRIERFVKQFTEDENGEVIPYNVIEDFIIENEFDLDMIEVLVSTLEKRGLKVENISENPEDENDEDIKDDEDEKSDNQLSGKIDSIAIYMKEMETKHPLSLEEEIDLTTKIFEIKEKLIQRILKNPGFFLKIKEYLNSNQRKKPVFHFVTYQNKERVTEEEISLIFDLCTLIIENKHKSKKDIKRYEKVIDSILITYYTFKFLVRETILITEYYLKGSSQKKKDDILKNNLEKIENQFGLSKRKLKSYFTELKALIEKYEEYKNQMIEANTRLVISLSKRYINKGMDFMDVIQEGNKGLITAVERFDPGFKKKFSTYASWWIKQEILKALANQGKFIRIPAYVVGTIRKVLAVRRDLTHRLNREPSLEEIAENSEIPEGKIMEALSLTLEPIYLEMEVGEDQNLTLENLIEDENSMKKFEKIDKDDNLKRLVGLINNLPDREAEIIKYRYGFNSKDPFTLQELGELLNLTRERVRQLEKRALKTLKKPYYSKKIKKIFEE